MIAAFLHLSVCSQNPGVKGARPSFISRFGANDRGLPSHLGLWPKQRGERTTACLRGERSAAFLHLLVCGQNRGVEGARPSFTSRFVGLWQNGGVVTPIFLMFSLLFFDCVCAVF